MILQIQLFLLIQHYFLYIKHSFLILTFYTYSSIYILLTYNINKLMNSTIKHSLLIYDSEESDQDIQKQPIPSKLNSEIQQQIKNYNYTANKLTTNFLLKSSEQQLDYESLQQSTKHNNLHLSNGINQKGKKEIIDQEQYEDNFLTSKKNINKRINKKLSYSDEENENNQQSKSKQKEEKVQLTKINMLLKYSDDQSDKQDKQAKQNKQDKQQKLVTQKQNPQKLTKKSEDKKITQISSSEVVNRDKFILNTINPGYSLQLTIKRDKTGFNMFWPQYDLHFRSDYKYFLSVKKKNNSTNSNYYISSSSYEFEKGPNLIGKIKKDSKQEFIYNIYSSLEGVQKMNVNMLKGTVVFNPIGLPTSSPRSILLYTIKQEYKYSDLHFPISYNENEINLHNLYEKNKNMIELFRNRTPHFDKKIQGFVMDFGGRIAKPSIKNFIMEDSKGNEVMMFGRMGDDIFTLHTNLISPLISIGTIIGNFDFKN